MFWLLVHLQNTLLLSAFTYVVNSKHVPLHVTPPSFTDEGHLVVIFQSCLSVVDFDSDTFPPPEPF